MQFRLQVKRLPSGDEVGHGREGRIVVDTPFVGDGDDKVRVGVSTRFQRSELAEEMGVGGSDGSLVGLEEFASTGRSVACVGRFGDGAASPRVWVKVVEAAGVVVAQPDEHLTTIGHLPPERGWTFRRRAPIGCVDAHEQFVDAAI